MAPVPFESLGAFVEHLSDRRPDDPALRFAGRTWTRHEVAHRARALASGWYASGYAPGDVVGVIGDTGPGLAFALLSAARAGLVPLLIDPRLTTDELDVVLSRAAPRALALCGVSAPAACARLPAFVFDSEGCPALDARRADPPPIATDPCAPAVFVVTSGTSGCIRVVSLSARNLSANILSGSHGRSCGPDDVCLSVLPLTHAFELTVGFLGPLACGASVVFSESRNPLHLIRLLVSERVTHLNVVPALLQMLIENVPQIPDAMNLLAALRPRLRSIGCGGAPTSPELVALAARMGLPLWLGYGLTEASPLVALGRADALPPGSAGRVLPGIEVHVDARTGELLVRGPNVMIGYVSDPAATAAAIEDGWLHTGDLARVDEEAHVFILGRCRDAIVTSAGLKLSLEDIERAYRSPLFGEVCAIGVPDGAGGERPYLVVVPSREPGANEGPLLEEFRRLSAGAASRQAFGLTVRAAPLPRTRTMKVRRDIVRQSVLDSSGPAGAQVAVGVKPSRVEGRPQH